jgi:hypothetical protein
MSDRIPEHDVEPRPSAPGGRQSNPYVSTLLGIWIVAGVSAGFFFWAGRDSDPNALYDPEGDLYAVLAYALSILAVAAALVHLGVKAVLWTAPVDRIGSGGDVGRERA